MRAQDFRIGNLYEATDGSGASFVTGKDLYAWDQGAVYGRPIPLTEEWLVKFGLYCVHKANKHYAIQTTFRFEHTISVHPTINDKWCIAFSENCMGDRTDYISPYTIQFVHQLMNLFYALTGQELTLI